MSIKKIKVPKFNYKNELGKIILKHVEVTLDEDDYKSFREGTPIYDLDYGISGDCIEYAEKEIAKNFYMDKYQLIIRDEYRLSVKEIAGIQDFLGLSNVEFSLLLGIDKAALTNIYKRKKFSRSVGLLIIERLGMELSRRGSAKGLANNSLPISSPDKDTTKEINKSRYKRKVA
ncbi:MAG: hypothetical protein HQK49_22995 [Oligoflexia bacterium]|nr:hypothetical protein [Oligoflexia bacterium]